MTGNDEHDGGATDLQKLPMLGHYEERRSYPRIDYREDVIISAGGQILNGRVRKISVEGLQVRCTPDTARTLHPRGTRITPGKGPVVVLRLELPVDGKPCTFAAEAQMTYITPRSKDEIAFGVHFKRISPKDKKILAAFIFDSLRPTAE